MSRLELIYTCVSNLVCTIDRDGAHDLVKGFEEYLDPNNRNQVVYYKQDIPQSQRTDSVKILFITIYVTCKIRRNGDYYELEIYHNYRS